MFSIGVPVTRLHRRSGGAPAPAPSGVSATTFTTAPQTHYHPNSQAGSVTKSGDRVTACPDLKGLAAMTATAGTAPVEMTDALGRKFWRFEGLTGTFAQIATSFASTARETSAILVCRPHNHHGAMVSFGQNGGSTISGLNIGLIHTTSSGVPCPVMRPIDRFATQDATNKKWMPIGCQLQVLAVRSGTTIRSYVNNSAAILTQTAYSAGFAGMELGRSATSANGYGSFDLYELALYNTSLSDVAMDAAVAQAVSNFSIAPITATLALEGDSRVQGHGGFSDVTSGTTLAMVLSAPGAGYVPNNFRVVSLGISGNQVSDMLSRRDTANGLFANDMDIGGEKHIAFIIGANDSGNTTKANTNYPGSTWGTVARGDEIIAAEKSLIYTASTGYLQRGWTVTRMVEPAAQQPELNTSMGQMRTRIREAAYLTDAQAGSGQANDGKLRRIELPNISTGGQTPFNGGMGWPNAYYDAAGGLHFTILGTALMASGGDTPTLGWNAVV